MKKVLIVNSVRSYLEKEESILNRSTIRILATTSPKEALLIHEQEKADLVLADLEMAEIPGDELCRLLRRNGELKQVPVILACFNLKEARDRVTSCRANDWVAKPVDPAELLKKVEQLLAVQARKAFRALVSTTVDGRFGPDKFYSTAQNISTSGILIESDKLLEKGNRVSCSFYLPGSEQLVVEGVVMRVVKIPGRYQYGLQFTRLERGQLQAIEKYVEQER